jgi:hypothetical protein
MIETAMRPAIASQVCYIACRCPSPSVFQAPVEDVHCYALVYIPPRIRARTPSSRCKDALTQRRFRPTPEYALWTMGIGGSRGCPRGARWFASARLDASTRNSAVVLGWQGQSDWKLDRVCLVGRRRAAGCPKSCCNAWPDQDCWGRSLLEPSSRARGYGHLLAVRPMSRPGRSEGCL